MKASFLPLRPFRASTSQAVKRKPIVTPLKDILSSIKVNDILHSRGKPIVYTVDVDDMVYSAVKLMSEKNVGCVAIVRDKQPLGLFTESIYRQRIILRNRSSKSTRIGDVIDKLPKHLVVAPHFSLFECASIMSAETLRHVPVADFIGDTIDQDCRLIGIVSSRDVIRFLKLALDQCTDVEVEGTMEDVCDSISRKHTSEFFLTPNDTVFKALELMEKHAINSVIIHDGVRLAGIFTERDYLHKVVLKDRASKNTKLGDVMSRDVHVLPGNASFAHGLRLMVEKGIRNLPILPLVAESIHYSDEKQPVIGLATEIDIISFVLKQANMIKD